MSKRVVVYGQFTEDLETERGILEPIGVELIDARQLDEPQLREAFRTADAVLFRRGRVTREHIDQMGQCTIICTYAAGYDHIDVEAASAKGIMVANTPGYGNDEVADHALTLLFALTRRLVPQVLDMAAAVERGDIASAWNHFPYTPIRRIRGQTMGIIGLGRIGKTTAWKAQGLGMNVIAHDPYVPEEVAAERGVPLVPLDELLRRADYVVIHALLTPETNKLIGARELALMKPSAYLINVARGKIVDHAALVAALQAGRIAGAGLDVVETEPPPVELLRELIQFPNVLVTPHNAWYSEESITDRERIAAENVREALQGGIPEAVVNRAAFT
ncbi:MAG TPA: C-terminal binding protein [Thermomicrobiaceae bacterium]|nr:C-terminal binding protein [Thermomicrobiaceae bacterium]